jgi:hypothetical protein
MAQDEFVDLYALLEVEPDADAAIIRRRLSEKYLEAQSNLDHRNAAKRLQYQQMYELYLPQARHLLLDEGRRAEYNRYLTAYRSGTPLQDVESREAPAAGRTAPSGIPEMDAAEEQVDPEKLAADREQLWGKWKSSLNFEDSKAEQATGASNTANSNTATSTSSFSIAEPEQPVPAAPTTTASTTTASTTAAATAPATTPATPARPASPRAAATGAASSGAASPGATTPRSASPAATRPTAVPPRPSPYDIRGEAEEIERHRQMQREEMIKNAAQSTGLMWAFIVGAITLVLTCVVLFVADSEFSKTRTYPVGLSRVAFNSLGFLLVILLSVVGAFIASGIMRAKALAQISSLPIEELQRRYRK